MRPRIPKACKGSRSQGRAEVSLGMGRIDLEPWPSSFGSFGLKGKPPAEPPIHCGGADERKELLETMQLRSAGERSTGRKEDGPATKQLKNYMAEQEGQPPPKACAGPKHDFSGMKKETLIATPFKIERRGPPPNWMFGGVIPEYMCLLSTLR